MFVTWALVEAGRLYLGRRGNRMEKVPHIAGFLGLTVIPQMLVMLQYAWFQHWLLPMDVIFAGTICLVAAMHLLVFNEPPFSLQWFTFASCFFNFFWESVSCAA